jgi:hypothetical protein
VRRAIGGTAQLARTCVVATFVGCISVRSADKPDDARTIAGIGIRGGVAVARETSASGAPADGPAGSGTAFGGNAFINLRLTKRLSAGLGVDFALSFYESKIRTEEDEWKTELSWVWLPTPNLRYDLGRFAITGWGGYYVGFRSVSQPGGTFGTRTHSSNKADAIATGISTVVRVGTEGSAFEAGPYLQFAHLRSKENDFRTSDFDESGLVSNAFVVGLALGAAFGGPDPD